MYELSILVLYGIIEKEQLEAYEYTLKAIEVNYPPACYVLGKFYEQGIVVESNIEKACECYLASAELGYSISQYALGRIYDQIFKQSKNNKIKLSYETETFFFRHTPLDP
jgi:TPR repeat protein